MSEHGTRAARGERTAADLSSLLVELGRALRGIGFYPEGDGARSELIGRAFLAMRGELERSGPLELSIGERTFRASGVGDEIPHGHLADLAEALSRHAVERIEFSQALTRDALLAFVELLERTPESLERIGGLARGLAARSSAGIEINGGEAAAPEETDRLSATPAAPALPVASLGSSLLARTRDLVPDAASERDERRCSAAGREAPARCDAEAAQAAPEEKPALEDRPLEAPAGDERGERLRFRLIELDRCTDDSAYEFLGKRIVRWAGELFDEGVTDECYRALLVLSDHAVGEGGRSGLQARMAAGLCAELADRARIADVIERARAGDVRASVRATRVLLQLGEAAIPPLFDRLLRETRAGRGRADGSPEGTSHAGEERGAQLRAILIALGETAVPHVRRMFAATEARGALLALRLAGEMQNQSVVPALIGVLGHERPEMRREAARALAHLGGRAAVEALCDALASDRDELPEIAAHCLGAMREHRAVQPLEAALERAIRTGDVRRAREVIRALGAIGDDRAAPKLVALVERRPLVRRRWLGELQLAAVQALGELPGREAHRALERAASHRDARVRDRAAKLVAERRRRR